MCWLDKQLGEVSQEGQLQSHLNYDGVGVIQVTWITGMSELGWLQKMSS